jgi:aryl-alcohol dehydrogenase-like predicted oxidoreductase
MIMDACVAAGGNFHDTADLYERRERDDRRALVEGADGAGKARVSRPRRGFRWAGPNDIGPSRRHLGAALDASLKRLSRADRSLPDACVGR